MTVLTPPPRPPHLVLPDDTGCPLAAQARRLVRRGRAG